jgi:ParB family chromosome partitioning protein
VDRISPSPFQPRQVVDGGALARLADSIRQSGVMQPVLVRARGDRYELIAGERRWRAAQLAGLKEIPAIVREIDDQTAAEWALVENVQREDLNAVERAAALRALLHRFGLTQEQLAERLGMDRSTIANLIRLMELEKEVLELISAGKLSAGHGKALLAIPAGGRRVETARTAALYGWSVRKLEQVAREPIGSGGVPGASNGRAEGPRDAVLRDLERQLGQQLGTKVVIYTDRGGARGRLVVEFYGLDHFEGLMSKLGVHSAP